MEWLTTPSYFCLSVFSQPHCSPLDSFPLFWKRRHFEYVLHTDEREDAADFLDTGFAFRLVRIFIGKTRDEERVYHLYAGPFVLQPTPFFTHQEPILHSKENLHSILLEPWRRIWLSSA
jgi:hypothetical protein